MYSCYGYTCVNKQSEATVTTMLLINLLSAINSSFTQRLHESVRRPSPSAKLSLFRDATLPPNVLMSSSSLLIDLGPAR